VDIYSTNEPQHAFHQRISFCLGIHNECVKAMRFPLHSKNPREFEDVEDVRERVREISDMVDEEMEGDDEPEF
jgi:26S proteasome regulatory subunit N3